ncbi:MAG: ParB/RepB/Spo0J family partition protein [Dethiobacter sp.]|jgi:ParB family chromosome partitioning protein|nr:MAG: ParB/RepB/Spo0J family partition protein [Dethiobacter sp.]
MSKQRLGKGLGALIPEFKNESIDLKNQGVTEIPIEKIKPNPQQPRKDFAAEKLRELADTIKTYGVIQPVILHKENESYILVAGERRFRAAQLVGLRTIPAIIKEYYSKELMEIALVENLQREDLNPLEEADAYKRLIEEFGFIQEELSQKVGRSRSAIANSLRLLSLDDEVKKHLTEGRMSPGQARPLLSLSSPEEQRQLALKIINKSLTARDVENLVKNLKRKKESPDIKKEKDAEKQLQQLLIIDLEEKIRKRYGTKVNIKKDTKEGKIEIYFYGEEDLERLLDLLLKEVQS